MIQSPRQTQPRRSRSSNALSTHRVVGQLMYGMGHAMIGIMYALNVLSRYGNNPGPRHIEFLKHLLKYCKYSKMDRLMFHTHDGPTDSDSMTKIHHKDTYV